MSLYKFILKSLWYFRRQHFAVLAGTIVSTAVLTGALIVGDSVKYTLSQLVENRLGATKFALQTGDRFVRTELADEISKKLNIPAAPLLMVQGIAINSEKGYRINSTNVLGVKRSFWQLSDIKMPELKADEAIISTNTAQKLNLQIGDEFLLRVQNADVIPLNAPFVSQENNSVALRLKVSSIADDESLGRFSLKSNQTAPYNIFVSHEFLSDKLELQGLSNLIIVAEDENQELNLTKLDVALKELWQLEDVGIKINELTNQGKYELVSNRIFIDEAISKAVADINIPFEPVLTYLVNSISFNDKETPYSFVTAATKLIVPEQLLKNEIVINEWLADDLQVKKGDSIDLKYFIIGPLRTLAEESKSFIIKDIIPTQSTISNNSLMPSFPGLSDAGNCRDWETGIPIDLDKIRDKDEEYWNNYRGTPKAFISSEMGQQLWNNKFGNYTAIRFNQTNIEQSKLQTDLLEKLNPGDFKLAFIDVKTLGVNAANNSVDFGELFLSLSFFVIVAGILLTILIYSLNTESRKQETGILSGLGYKKNQIIKIRFAESIFIIVLGGILGSVLGIVYNYGIIAGLNSIWQDAVKTNLLQIFISPGTLIIGALSGIIIALIAIYFVTIKSLKNPIASLVKENVPTLYPPGKINMINKLLSIIGIFGSASLVLYSLLTSVDENAALFLSAGALFILGSTALLNQYLKNSALKIGNRAFDLRYLALKNAGRNKGRSLATVVLLALGAFTIIITSANRKTFHSVEDMNSSGTGGYTFWAETTLPILYNLNTDEGKKSLGLENEKVLEKTRFVQFHSLDGDDASCLNLNQVQNPRILGINPDEFTKKQAFSFAKLLNGISRSNTWQELNKLGDDHIIPAIADQTVITWGLKKSVGDTLIYLNEQGEKIKLVLIAGLNGSVFQGNILISDSLFSKHFPSSSGSKIMLIDTDKAKQNEIAETLNTNLADYGIQISKASDRLAEFYSVTNTYLSVFMALGGLGVLIGTIGLGIILLRNMLERKHELALLLAVGYKKTEIFKLIFAENLFLLLGGLIIGIIAAIIGVLPSILSPSFNIPGTFMFLMILAVFVNGLLWIYIPAQMAMKGVLIKSLSTE